MDKEKSSAPAGMPNTWVWLALLAGGMMLFREAPWLNSRSQVSEPQAYRYIAQQDVDARLWQDPLGAVARSLAAEGKPQASDALEQRRHSAATLAADIEDRSTQARRILTIGAMVRGGSYAEASEARRRARYAILAGLNEQGYVPENAEHLGYFTTALREENSGQLPKLIAYEWFRPKESDAPALPTNSTRDAQAPIDQILLLWLDEDVFGTKTFTRLDKLTQEIAPAFGERGGNRKLQLLVLGPGASTTLQEMVKNSRDVDRDTLAQVPFYAWGATADDAHILNRGNTAAESVHDFFKQQNRHVFRSIGTDNKLAETLAAELQLRGVHPDKNPAPNKDGSCPRCQHIVLVSEWDSLYGRALPVTMTRALLGNAAIANDSAETVHRYSYLRGLDGLLPSTRGGDDVARNSADNKKSGDDARDSEKLIERAEGQSQFDYLRRLSLQLRLLEKNLRVQDRGEITAVGVLGSDVYDKLLILQALRQEFPGAIFFTTDLDARMLHPRELDWTRNLIVASSFGLELDKKLQRDIPPFRDSYQSALYLSTLVAVYNANHGEHCANADEQPCFAIDQSQLDTWLRAPRLFEIGRHGAFDFGASAVAPQIVAPQIVTPKITRPQIKTTANTECELQNLEQCLAIEPAAPALFTAFAKHTLQKVCALLVAAALAISLALGGGQKIVHWIKHGAPRSLRVAGRSGLLFVAAVAVIAFVWRVDRLWFYFADYLSEHGAGEPVFAFAGISVWPTELIRAISLLLSVWFISFGMRSLNKNINDISDKLMCQPERHELIKQLAAEYQRWPRWLQFLRMLSFQLREREPSEPSSRTGLSVSAEMFWKKYIYQSRGIARTVRILAATILYFFLSGLIIQFFGNASTPYRGTVAEHWNSGLIILSVLAMQLLIFFVIDATVLCCHLLSELRWDSPTASNPLPGQRAESRWPQQTLKRFAAETQLDERYLDYWINMHMIACRTRVVGNLIYFPFVIIALMLLSRSSIFDHWSLTAGLIIVMGTSLLLVSACALALRWQAERARTKALWRLSNEKIRLKGGDDAARRTAEQLDAMIVQIRNFSGGAFAPYSQQPLLRALLIPLSSYGGAVLLEYFNFAQI